MATNNRERVGRGFSAASRRPARVTRYPSAASRNAVARPIPDPAPVTSATRSIRATLGRAAERDHGHVPGLQ